MSRLRARRYRPTTVIKKSLASVSEQKENAGTEVNASRRGNLDGSRALNGSFLGVWSLLPDSLRRV